MKSRTVARTPLDSSPDSSPDTSPDSLDITEAAARLGLSTETVRKRLQRGKIKGHKAADGSWRVFLPPDRQPGQPQDNSPDSSPDSSPDRAAPLVAALRDEVAFLRSQLQARDEEIRRAHVLLQQAQQQSMALLAAPQQPEPPRPPWWRRLFGRNG